MQTRRAFRPCLNSLPARIVPSDLGATMSIVESGLMTRPGVNIPGLPCQDPVTSGWPGPPPTYVAFSEVPIVSPIR